MGTFTGLLNKNAVATAPAKQTNSKFGGLLTTPQPQTPVAIQPNTFKYQNDITHPFAAPPIGAKPAPVIPATTKGGADISTHVYNPQNPNVNATKNLNKIQPAGTDTSVGANFDPVGDVLPGFKKAVGNIVSDPFNLKNVSGNLQDNLPSNGLLPLSKNATDAMWNAIKAPVMQEAQNIKDYFNRDQSSPASNLAASAKVLSGGANVLFSPVTALFEGANQIPILGTVSKLVSLPFQVSGEAATASSNAIIDKLPISQKAKDQLKPAIGDISALAAQIVVGGGVTEAAWDTLKGKYGETDATTIVRKAQEVAAQQGPKVESNTITELPKAETPPSIEKPVEAAPKENIITAYHGGIEGEQPAKLHTDFFMTTSKEEAANYAKRKYGEEGMVTQVKVDKNALTGPDDALVHKNGSEAYLNKDGVYRVKPAAEPTIKEVKPEQPTIKSETTPDVQSTTTAQSKIGKSIEAKAIEAGLTKGFDGVAGYDKLTIKDQADRAAKLMTNMDDARAVLRGEKPLPEGLRGTALITAMEEHLKANPDPALAEELANSPHVSATSAAAQELRLAAEREPDSATAKLAEMKKNLVEKAGGEKQVTAKKSAAIKDTLAKEKSVLLPKEEVNWDNFLEKIKC